MINFIHDIKQNFIPYKTDTRAKIILKLLKHLQKYCSELC